MVLRNGWMIPVWVGLLAVVAAVYVLVRLRRQGRDPERRLPVSGTSALRDSARYAVLMRRYRVLLSAALVSVLAVLVGSVLLTARVSATSTHDPERVTRDVMLCLDVSGSMLSVDAQVMDTFADLVDGLEGERIALTIFNSSARTVFPLTDDYEFVKQQLTDGRSALTRRDYTYVSGTMYGSGSSLIGDGLASCLSHFDEQGGDRPRSVIFATDNDLRGEPIVTLSEASLLAKDKKIRVFALSPETGPTSSEEITDLNHAAESTDGHGYSADDSAGVDHIVTAIHEQEAKRVRTSAPQLLVADRPRPMAVLSLLGVLTLIGLAWRLER